MISHQYKCIFIHVPKCAGTSIETFLKDNTAALGHKKEPGLEYKMREEGLAQMINLYPDYFTFTFVRNPFARFVSTWKHSERGKGYYFKRNQKNLSFQQYARIIQSGKEEELSYFDRYHTKKQIDFILDCHPETFFGVTRKTNKKCDFIGRFENLKEDFRKLCNMLNVPNSELPQKMMSPDSKKWFKKPYHDYYNPEIIEIIQNLYGEDFDFLGYDRHNLKSN